jgi:BON domain
MKSIFGRRTASGRLRLGLGGMAAGAAIAYWLDPERGARRRAELRQRALHAGKEATQAASVTARDVAHRVTGAIAGARGHLKDAFARLRGEVADDAVLAERVRARLGRVSSHPGAIEVTAREGCIELRGPVLTAERLRLVRTVRGVRGVLHVDDQLVSHDTSEGVPGLQGGISRRGERPELLQDHWSPAARLLTGVAGVSLVRWGTRAWTPVRIAGVLAGLGLLVRSALHLPARRLTGVGPGRRGVDLQKEMLVEATEMGTKEEVAPAQTREHAG